MYVPGLYRAGIEIPPGFICRVLTIADMGVSRNSGVHVCCVYGCVCTKSPTILRVYEAPIVGNSHTVPKMVL